LNVQDKVEILLGGNIFAFFGILCVVHFIEKPLENGDVVKFVYEGEKIRE